MGKICQVTKGRRLRSKDRACSVRFATKVSMHLNENLPYLFMIVFARKVKIIDNGFFSFFICPVPELLRFIQFEI